MLASRRSMTRYSRAQVPRLPYSALDALLLRQISGAASLSSLRVQLQRVPLTQPSRAMQQPQRDDNVGGYQHRQGRTGQGAAMPTSRTGFFLRARMQSALEVGSNYVNAALAAASERDEEQQKRHVAQASESSTSSARRSKAPSTSSASSSASRSYEEGGSGRAGLTRSLRSKSSSLLSAAAAGIDRSLAASPVSQRSIAESSNASIISESSSKSRARRSTERGRQIVDKMKTGVVPRQFSTYSPQYSSKGVNNDEYRKHNLFPLPPPGHVQPILLPTYAIRKEVLSGAEAKSQQQHKRYDIDIRIDGFVEHWPDRVGTGQRLFMQLARQLANLPRLPRQQPAPYHRRPKSQDTAQQSQSSSTTSAAASEVAGLTPLYTSNLSSSPGQSGATTPVHADTDDATFFPETPNGVSKRRSSSSSGEDGDGALVASGLAEHALAHGAPDRAIGKVLQKMGALPLEDQVHEGWQQSVENAAAQVQEEEINAAEAAAKQHGPTAPVGPLGGAAFWANRTHEEVEKLWRTLEHRLRCFWTYRKPYQDVVIEIVPVFRNNDQKRDISWIVDEYGIEQETAAASEEDLPPLLALTDLKSDAQGLFSTILTISSEKIEHYLAHVSSLGSESSNAKGVHDIIALRMRARLASAGGHHNTTAAINASKGKTKGASTVTQATSWQMLRISDDSPSTVHVICDIDDTSKHTHVLGGARAVTRNVFARPFEEVTVPGVKEWFTRLSPAWQGQHNSESECTNSDVHGGHVSVSDRENASSGALVNHFHYVTNAPAEMHAIIKAYMSTADLPAGTLLLKHYFSSGRGRSGSDGSGSSTGGGGVMAWLQTYMQPPSARKRQNLLRCLDDFPNTAFILIGDSGEMDIEVYSELAAQRPQQVRAIWIRNVGNVSPAAQRLVEQREGGKTLTDGHAEAGAAAPPRNKRLSYPPTSLGASDATSSSSSGNSSDESMTRVQKAIAALPPTTHFRFWRTGHDIVDKSIQQVRAMRSASMDSAQARAS